MMILEIEGKKIIVFLLLGLNLNFFRFLSFLFRKFYFLNCGVRMIRNDFYWFIKFIWFLVVVKNMMID